MADESDRYNAGRDLTGRVLGGVAGLWGGPQKGAFVQQQATAGADDVFTLATGKAPPTPVDKHNPADEDGYHRLLRAYGWPDADIEESLRMVKAGPGADSSQFFKNRRK